MTIQEEYEARIERILKTVNHEEPDRVPVFTIIDLWNMSYYGTTYQECLDDPAWYIKEVCSKIYKEMKCDMITSSGLLNNLEFDKIVGGGTRFISEDGITVQHKEGVMMGAEDYPKLIKDPWDFFITDLIPQKYPNTSIEKVAKGIESIIRVGEPMSWIADYYREELGLPFIAVGGYVFPPLDFLFDSLRGFKGTVTDLRRIPDQVLAAAEVLCPILEPYMGLPNPPEKSEPFPFAMTNMHSPTYLSKKQFEKFFAPTYEKMINKLYESGRKLFLFLEGDWQQHYDWLNSLPKNFVIGLVEKDDIVEMKKKVGDNITLVGGMPLNVLKYESKKYCLDYAKRIVDICAPGGGYMFGTDKVLQSAGDVNTENFIAVNNFVYEYAYYK
ncbi:MAG: uroporphyrinogen decarboxylase family protein [Eubacteriales bacterium]